MKKGRKRLWAAILTLVMIVSTISSVLVVGAATDSDVVVTVTTDKYSYSKNEKVSVTVDVKNNTGKEITDAVATIKLPEGVELVEGQSTTITLGTIAAGGTVTKAVETKVSNDAGNSKTGDSVSLVLPITLLVVAAAAIVLLIKFKGTKAAKTLSIVALVIIGGASIAMVAEAAPKKMEAKGSTKIEVEKVEKTIEAVVEYTIDAEVELDPSSTDISRVSVHDPSIIKDPETGMYYIFGSHMAWAKSEDLVNWTTFTNNINKNYATIFAKEAEWAARGSSSYDVSGNLWAPDIIWNEELGKWCMYMSVNGDNWYTSIALLTADSLEGDWTYVDTIVYSGFTNAEEAADTDFAKVTGTNEVPDRYLANRNGNRTYGMNAIDPCVFYDEEGTLWMAYGSWFGGIYMLKLDEATGLRDYTYTYETVDNTSDEYQGHKIAGGQHCSGEAAYIEYIDGNYYLFMSYGGLTANGGYNMRVFRSENPTGPFVDASGDDARFTAGTNNINGTVGIKLMGNYQWSYMKYGHVAQGHNSAFVDDDGRAYVVYHTRTTDGTEGHSVRVHQLFTNEDGWLVAAPYEYRGETISETGYSKDAVVGTYETLYHKQSINYGGLECVTADKLILNADGTVSGNYEGTWTMTDNSPYVQLVLGDTEYKGVFIEQYIEEYNEKTMCFTLLGDNEVELWGSKYLTGEDAIDMSLYFDIFNMPSSAVANINLVTEGLYGTTATYKSNNTAVISDAGVVTRPEQTTNVTITATFKNGDAVVTKDYTVKVLGTGASSEDGRILVQEYYTGEKLDISSATEGTYQEVNPFNKNITSGLQIYNGVSVEFDVEGTGTYLSNILSFFGAGRLYFTGGSYLGYNATGGFFDANVDNVDPWSAGTDYINGKATIRIDILPTGFEVYSNGVLAYDSTDLANGDIQGGIDAQFGGYSSVLKWLNETASTINFGWGSWWADNFNGTISNVKLYAYPIEQIDTSAYVYYDDFSMADSSAWNVRWDSFCFSFANDGDTHGTYVAYNNSTDPDPNSSKYGTYPSGNRNCHTTFALPETLTGGYKIETDFRITPGNHASGVTQFVISGTDFSYTENSGANSGYILKLATTAGSTEYTVNDGAETITIPKGEWVTVSAIVDAEGDVEATFTFADGSTEVVNTTVNGSGELGGIYLLRGRGGAEGKMHVDNVKVSYDDTDVSGASAVALMSMNGAEMTYHTLADYDFTNSNVPADVTLGGNGATATADGIKLVDGYIDLPSTLFANLPDDAEKLVVEMTMSKQTSTWSENEWSERLFNFTDDNNTTDGVQNGTTGLALSYNGNIGTTIAPYKDGGSYMDSALTGTYSLGKDTMHTVKVEFDFATNTASLYLDGTLVKSAAATGDSIEVSDVQNFTYNSIGRSADMWSMWGFMTVKDFSVSYGITE